MVTKPAQGLHPLSVIEHPKTGARYLVAKNFMSPEGDFVNHSIVRISNTTSYESYETHIYNRNVLNGMGIYDAADHLYISAKAQSFNDVFHGITHVKVLGNITEGTPVARTFANNYANENRQNISTFMERDVQRVLEGRGGRLAPSHQIDDEIVPVEIESPTEDTAPIEIEPTDSATEQKPKISAAIARIAANIPARGGANTQSQKATASVAPETASKPTKITGLDALKTLFTDESLGSGKLNPADFTLSQAAERVGYNLSDLTMHVIAGETIMGSNAPQWILKDSAPQNSPFRGQSLNLQDVFDLFANENISEKDISKSINFAGPKVASEITAMIRDPQFRSQFDIK